MRRTGFAVVLSLGLITLPLVVAAQQADKSARIGYLAFNLRAGDPRMRASFLQGLHDLGYVDGRNVQIEYRDAQGETKRLPALAAELVTLKVDVIVTFGGTLGVLAAKRATTTIPIVFGAAGDPVGDGIVTSLARPGGNVTGLSLVSPELATKSLELIKQAVPAVTRVAFLVPDRGRKDRLEAADAAARGLGVRLQIVEARGPEDFERKFDLVINLKTAKALGLTIPQTLLLRADQVLE